MLGTEMSLALHSLDTSYDLCVCVCVVCLSVTEGDCLILCIPKRIYMYVCRHLRIYIQAKTHIHSHTPL